MKKPTALKQIWGVKLSDKNFRLRFIFSVLIQIIVLYALAKFLPFNEQRAGFSFNDPFLNLFHPIELTWITFAMIYGALIVGLYILSFEPEKFVIAFQAYSLTAFFRLVTIFFLPLKAPQTIIPLTDPFIEFFGGGETLFNDLFFSGHTSTMFLLYLTGTSIKSRRVFLILTLLVGLSVLMQHVHYTIDVLAAPFFAFTCFKIVMYLNFEFLKK